MMKYADGSEVRLGDRVELWPGNRGTVVCSIDTSEFSSAYPKKQWSYLGSGILILSEQAGLIHYNELEATTKLLSRSQ